MSSPRVAVVVLNWNRAQETAACLRSIEESDWPALTTIVVDNASREPLEGSLGGFPDTILIRNPVNLGFAGGMNVGLARALELGVDYVLLLNNDTLVEPTMIRLLVDAARAHPDAGIVSPLVLDRDSPERVLSGGWRFDPRRGHPGRPVMAGLPTRLVRGSVIEVTASSGEAMLVPAAVARAVGPLDESLYLRLEDVDWSLRMRASGLRNLVALDARLWHAGSASSGGEHSALVAYYHTRNILSVCARHAPMRGLRGLAREGETLLANLIHARRGDAPTANARAVLSGWLDYRRGRMGARGGNTSSRSAR